MEDTGFISDQVHVLRQTFRPNEPFHAALLELITTEARSNKPFAIYGTDERIVELDDLASRQFNIQKRDADKYMQTKHNVRMQLDGEVSARILKTASRGAVALQLIMRPENTAEFVRIRDALDMIDIGRPSQALGFEATRLYMNIPFAQLRTAPEVRAGVAKINSTVQDGATHRLFQIIPEPHLVGQFVPRASSQLLKVNNPE